MKTNSSKNKLKLIKPKISENEKKYKESINKNKGNYDGNYLLDKYIKLEETNDRLKKLIYNFSNNENKDKRLNSVNSSMCKMENSTKTKCIYDPKYNFMNYKEKETSLNDIFNRSNNKRITNGHKKYKNQENFIFKSKIKNIPGPNIVKKSSNNKLFITKENSSSKFSENFSVYNKNNLKNYLKK